MLLYRNQEVDPLPKLTERIIQFSNTFAQNYVASSLMAINRGSSRGNITSNPSSDKALSKQRLELSTFLYWRLLENILRDELRRRKTLNISVSNIKV